MSKRFIVILCACVMQACASVSFDRPGHGPAPRPVEPSVGPQRLRRVTRAQDGASSIVLMPSLIPGTVELGRSGPRPILVGAMLATDRQRGEVGAVLLVQAPGGGLAEALSITPVFRLAMDGHVLIDRMVGSGMLVFGSRVSPLETLMLIVDGPELEAIASASSVTVSLGGAASFDLGPDQLAGLRDLAREVPPGARFSTPVPRRAPAVWMTE